MENELVETGAPNVPMMAPDKGMVDVEVARAVAQIQGAMTIAKKFPRDETLALNKIRMAAGRRKLAEQAEYEYNRGGSAISGPSIRAAETIAQAWGNIESGVLELSREKGVESKCMAYAVDLESNTWKRVVFTVPHIRETTKGNKVLTDSRDVYEMVMNQGSRRLRNALLAILPGDVVETFVEECNKTLAQHDKPLSERIAAMLPALDEVGVSKAMIEQTYQCKADALTERQLAEIRRKYTGIKDGFGKVADYFKTPPEQSGKGAELNQKLKAQAPAPAIKPKTEPDPAAAYHNAPDEMPEGGFKQFQQGAEDPRMVK